MQDSPMPLSIDLEGFAPGTSRWIGQDFLDIYFHEFHPVWPFLHQGTLKMEEEPCVLVQSMVMMGLFIKGDQKSRDTAMAFHENLMTAIEDQKVRNVPPVNTAQPSPLISAFNSPNGMSQKQHHV